MENENTKDKTIRPKRVLKPKLKESKTSKVQSLVNKKTKSVSVVRSTKASAENANKQTTLEGKVDQKHPLPPSEKVVCKKQAIRGTRKLGLFVIDCEEINGDRKINLEALKSFVKQNIKVDGKTNDERIQIDVQNEQILISAEIFVEQKYIKFLVKKFLKISKLHNWIKIENGQKMYKLKYFTM